MQANASLLGRQTIASDLQYPDSDASDPVPDLSPYEFDRHLRQRGVGPAGYRAYLALTCTLAKAHGYAYPTQAWLADALCVTVSTVGNYGKRAVKAGHQRIVRTGRSSEYYPQLEALGLAQRADQIRKSSRSLMRSDSKLDAVATAKASAPTATSSESAPLTAHERAAFRALPEGGEAWSILHRPWMRGSAELANKAARQVLQHDATKSPVLTAAGLLIKVFKDLLAEREQKQVCVAEETAREQIGEYKRPVRRAPPSQAAIDAKVAFKHNLGDEAKKVGDAGDILALLRKKEQPPDTGDPPHAETS